jgi:hypothetical protein
MILERLSGIAKAILVSPDLTEHHFHLIQLDIDRLEQTIAAPDPQSKEPADVGDSGLFDEEDEHEEEDVTELARETAVDIQPQVATPDNAEAKDVVLRVMKATEDLNKRFREFRVRDLLV